MRAWLRAELFLTNFRPVPLTEHAVFGGKVYEKLPPQARRTRQLRAALLCFAACPLRRSLLCCARWAQRLAWSMFPS